MTAVFQEYLWPLRGGWIREGKNHSQETREKIGEGIQDKAGGGPRCRNERRGHIGELFGDEKVRLGN